MITKELYFNSIDALKNYDKYASNIYDVSNGSISLRKHEAIERLEFALVELLEYCTKDENDSIAGTDLEYFMYELNFGKNYKSGCIVRDGKNVRCKTKEDLWKNFIIAKHPEVEDAEDTNN